MTKIALTLAIILISFSSCQSTRLPPAFVLPTNATYISANFKHLAITKPGNSQRLHVYIEGDGLPFKGRFMIAKDPSPVHPLMLHLMSMDYVHSLYLGRPCYFLRSLPELQDNRCNPDLWTQARYSDQVVSSMVTALRAYLEKTPAKGVSLIGHSGGGTLAMLMASRMSEVDQVVTLAGNLDITAWTSLHSYTPLKESLNPADLSIQTLPRNQLHFAGGKDRNIPATIGQSVLARFGLQIQLIENADHNCCWAPHWNDLLAQINRQMAH